MFINTQIANSTIVHNPNYDLSFTVIDGYLMTEQMAQRYRRLAPIRVLRAIDVLDHWFKDEYSNSLPSILQRLDYWSSKWVVAYLSTSEQITSVSLRERDMLFGRLMAQYYKVRDDGRL